MPKRHQPTNRTRAARRLQQLSDLTYAQALDLIRKAGHVPDLTNADTAAAFIAHHRRQRDAAKPAHSTAAPYRDGTWVTSSDGTVRACFTFIGEGYDGDYDETDPDDAALYRLDVNVAEPHLEVLDVEDLGNGEDAGWGYPSDGSICTHVRVDDLSEADAHELLAYASNMVAEALAADTNSVKGCLDRLSWLPRRPEHFC